MTDKILTVSIAGQLKVTQPTEYHYFELMRKGLIKIAIRLAKIETGIRKNVN